MLTSFDVGGTECQTVELVRRLDPARFRVHIACFRPSGRLLASIPESVSVTAFPVRGFRRPASVGQWLRFSRWCRQVDARLVHTCDLYANLFGLSGAAAARVPARIGSRREVITGDKTALQLAGQRMAYRAAQVVVANSSAAVDQLRREGVPDSRLHLIPNGVDPAPFQTPRTRDALRRIVTVANLRAEKGHDVLIDAAPAILAARPDTEFYVAGSGPMAEALAARAADRGVAGRVWFLGHCDHVAGLLAESDVFVLPSRSEASPNAVIEAMAAGLPVVASRVGGIPELITHGVNGTLVRPDDPSELARAVLDLMAHPSAAAALGRAARDHVSREYGFSRMVGRFEALYLAAIEQPSGVPTMETARA